MCIRDSLLNVGDGLVGQGLRILVLITTNEPPSRLHPALARPGRCLSSIAFRAFNPEEVRRAFPNAPRSAVPRTLAEITNGVIEEPSLELAGAYL